jgi:hypothetical protein
VVRVLREADYHVTMDGEVYGPYQPTAAIGHIIWNDVALALLALGSALRLSSIGIDVYPRWGKPRRYEWREIDRFMLVERRDDEGSARPGRSRPRCRAGHKDNGDLNNVVEEVWLEI